MSTYKVATIQNILFCTFLFVCLDNIPKLLQLSFISAGLASKLSWYPLFILTSVYLYKRTTKYTNFLPPQEERIVVWYLTIYIGIILASSILGIFSYPYYDEVINGPISQSDKISLAVNFFATWNIDISEENIIQGGIILRSLRNVIFKSVYTFGFAYIIYYFIKDNLDNSYALLTRAIKYSLYVMIIYSIIELGHLAGISIAKQVLSMITPFFHSIATEHDWWPPLLWKGQLRSILSEPSRIGNYAAFCLPFLWACILNRHTNSKSIIIITTVFSFMIFMTKARTAVAMYVGMILLLAVILLFLRNRNYLKRSIVILAISGIAFSSSIWFINTFMETSPNVGKVGLVASYVDDNLQSLASNNQRSNRARYALIKSNLKIGMDHPLLGVGEGLGTAYTVHYFDDEDKQSREVRKWIDDYYEEGVLKYTLDAMNEYVSRFSANGIIGLFLFCFPFLYAMWKLFVEMKNEIQEERQLKMLGVLLSLISSFVAGCNGSLTILYAPWIVLAFAYAFFREGN